MAHDPSLGFADYFSAAAVMPPAMEEGAPELFGLHADMELLGMPAAAAAHGSSKAVLIDAGGGADAATVRFLSDHHHQAPLSLSLCRPDAGMTTAATLHQQQQQQDHLGGASRHHHQQQQQAAWHMRSSRFLLPTQQLLREFCSLPVDTTATTTTTTKRATTKPSNSQQEVPDGGGDGSSSAAQIQGMDAVELQRLKDKLYIMLEEVDRRYRRYCEQMRSVAGGFEAVAGDRAAAAYTALASRTISRHFRSLRDGVVAQLQAVRKALGEKDVAVPGMTRGETPRLRVLDQCIRQHKALSQQAGMMETHPWRPQRGLPERAVTILRAWLFEHFLHPYPSDVDKHILARQTGLSRSQVSNWFINARVRLWKPMVEEMYVEEMKGEQQHQQDGGHVNPNPSSSQSLASAEAYIGGRHAHGAGEAADGGGAGNNNGIDRKPTREQLLHDAGSLAAVVNVGSGARLESLGVTMDHLDFDAYDGGGHHHQAAAAGFGGVSLTLGLQQHADSSRDTGVNIAFGAPPPPSAHHVGGYLQFAAGAGHHHQQMEFGGGGGGAGMDGGEAAHGQEHYRSLSAGFHLLRDLAG